ncbi:hypothetical protein, partial [Priestia megaterium]|uniref:hypothetical protein n=1 Tax=Priestia megaterium TaxID=1404 RepID=UPI001F347362
GLSGYCPVRFSGVAMVEGSILSIGGMVLGMGIMEGILEGWGVIDVVNEFGKVMGFMVCVRLYSGLIYFFVRFMF